MSASAEATHGEAVRNANWTQRAIGLGIMAVSLIVGTVGVEQSFDPPHSVDSLMIVGGIIGLLIGKEVVKN